MRKLRGELTAEQAVEEYEVDNYLMKYYGPRRENVGGSGSGDGNGKAGALKTIAEFKQRHESTKVNTL